MTPNDYEQQCEDEDDIAAQVREEAVKTGRQVREILAAMRDEGYIKCTDEAMERVAKIAEGVQCR